jgi:hypothetical protein
MRSAECGVRNAATRVRTGSDSDWVLRRGMPGEFRALAGTSTDWNAGGPPGTSRAATSGGNTTMRTNKINDQRSTSN